MIGVDFGGTRIKLGRVVDNRSVDTTVVHTQAASGPSEILDLIAESVLKLEARPEAVGFAIPGVVSPEGLCWRLPNVPGFEGLNLAEELRGRIDCRVVVENDATTAALAELHLGHGRQYSSFLVLTLGTGIGGGLVIDGRLRRGRHGFAGEVGHTPLKRSAEGWTCACGLQGCLESYAGTQALLRFYADRGGHAAEIRPIAEAARKGDAAALATFDEMGRALGMGIAGIQNLLDLDAFIFTGGISASFDLLGGALRESLRRHAFAPPLAEVPLLVSELGEQCGVLGAAFLTTL